ncbi:hypothetical protein KSD_07000 [Ktedonobacter sp. SOSP1-85]|nr:hypothetical protein KSD_07000 [Ktedonobacter sp. SOSP1-85]
MVGCAAAPPNGGLQALQALPAWAAGLLQAEWFLVEARDPGILRLVVYAFVGAISHAMYDKIIVLVGVLNQFAQAIHMHVNLCGRFACQ